MTGSSSSSEDEPLSNRVPLAIKGKRKRDDSHDASQSNTVDGSDDALRKKVKVAEKEGSKLATADKNAKKKVVIKAILKGKQRRIASDNEADDVSQSRLSKPDSQERGTIKLKHNYKLPPGAPDAALTGNAYLDEIRIRERVEAEADGLVGPIIKQENEDKKSDGKGKEKESGKGKKTKKKKKSRVVKVESESEAEEEEEEEEEEEAAAPEYIVDAITRALYCDHITILDGKREPSPSWTYEIKWHNFIFSNKEGTGTSQVENPITKSMFGGGEAKFVEMFWEELGMRCKPRAGKGKGNEKGKEGGKGQGKAVALSDSEEEEEVVDEPEGQIGDVYTCPPRLAGEFPPTILPGQKVEMLISITSSSLFTEWWHRLAKKSYEQDKEVVFRAKKTVVATGPSYRTKTQLAQLAEELKGIELCLSESERMRQEAARETMAKGQNLMMESKKSYRGADEEGDDYVPWAVARLQSGQNQGGAGPSGTRGEDGSPPPKKKKSHKKKVPDVSTSSKSIALPAPTTMVLPPNHSDRVRARERERERERERAKTALAMAPRPKKPTTNRVISSPPPNEVMDLDQDDEEHNPPTFAEHGDANDDAPKPRGQKNTARVIHSPPQLFAPDPDSEPEEEASNADGNDMMQGVEPDPLPVARPKPKSRQSYAPIWETGKPATVAGESSTSRQTTTRVEEPEVGGGGLSQSSSLQPPSPQTHVPLTSNGLLDGPAEGLPNGLTVIRNTETRPASTPIASRVSTGSTSSLDKPQVVPSIAARAIPAPTTPSVPTSTATPASSSTTTVASLPIKPAAKVSTAPKALLAKTVARAAVPSLPPKPITNPAETPPPPAISQGAAPIITQTRNNTEAPRPVIRTNTTGDPRIGMRAGPRVQPDRIALISPPLPAPAASSKAAAPASVPMPGRVSTSPASEPSSTWVTMDKETLPLWFFPPGLSNPVPLGTLELCAADRPAEGWAGLPPVKQGSVPIQLSRIVETKVAATLMKGKAVLQHLVIADGDDSSRGPFKGLMAELMESGQEEMVALASVGGFPDVTIIIHAPVSTVDRTTISLPPSRPYLRALVIQLDSHLAFQPFKEDVKPVLPEIERRVRGIMSRLSSQVLGWETLEVFGFTKEWFLSLVGQRVCLLGQTETGALKEAFGQFKVHLMDKSPQELLALSTQLGKRDQPDVILVDNKSVQTLIRMRSLREMVDSGTSIYSYGPRADLDQSAWCLRQILKVTTPLVTFSPKFMVKEPDLMQQILTTMSSLPMGQKDDWTFSQPEAIIIPQGIPVLDDAILDPTWCASPAKAKIIISKLLDIDTSPGIKVVLPVPDRPSNLFEAKTRALKNSLSEARTWREKVAVGLSQLPAPLPPAEGLKQILLGTGLASSSSLMVRKVVNIELAQLLDLGRRAQRPRYDLSFPRCVYVGSDWSLVEGLAPRFESGAPVLNLVELMSGKAFLESLGK